MENGGAGSQRLLRREDPLKQLVLGVDGLRGGAGGRLTLGDHQGQYIGDGADTLPGGHKDRLMGDDDTVSVLPGDIFGSEHGYNPGMRFGAARVEGKEHRKGMRAEDSGGVQLPLAPVVGPEVVSASHLGHAVLAHDGPPHHVGGGTIVEIDAGSWEIPPLFHLIQRTGEIPMPEMRRVFNLGIGMVAVLEAQHIPALQKCDPTARRIGRVVPGSGRVRFID